jgi:hypothetical protein
MEKLLELEKKLIEARAELKKGLGKDLNDSENRDRVSTIIGSIRPTAKVTDSEGNISEVSPKQQETDKIAAVKQKKDAARAKAETEAAARKAQYRKEGVLKSEEIAPEGSKNKESYEEEFGKKEMKYKEKKEDKEGIAEALDEHNEKKHGEAKDKNSAYKDAGLKKSESEVAARRSFYKKQDLMKNNQQWTLEFESLEKGGGALKAAIDTFNRKVTPKHIKYAKDAGHAYAHIDHPAANVEFKNPKHQEKFDDHVNGWLSGHDTSGSKEHPHDY